MWAGVGNKRTGWRTMKCVGVVGKIRKGVPRIHSIWSTWEADMLGPDSEELLSGGQHLPNAGSEF